MPLKHGSTTITVLKHGSTNITTGKHGSTTVFTVSSGPSWHTLMSDSFYPEDNVQQQDVWDIPSGATEVRVTFTWWTYAFDSGESNYDSDDVHSFSPANSDNVMNGGYGLGQSSYDFHVSGGKLYVDNSMEEGEYGLYYLEITKVEAYY